MSDYKKDLEQITAFLAEKSPLGAFQRQDETEFQVLKAEAENTGRILSKAEYVMNMRKVQHMLANAKLQAFLAGEELDVDTVANIEADIANFITELKNGVWE